MPTLIRQTKQRVPLIIVRTSELQPGAVLAKDLKDASGALMLAKGGTISAGLIRALQRMNIQEAAIHGGDSDDGEAAGVRIAALRSRFEGHEQNAFMSEIERIVREHYEKSSGPIQEAPCRKEN